jgi:hypothetical protein
MFEKKGFLTRIIKWGNYSHAEIAKICRERSCGHPIKRDER